MRKDTLLDRPGQDTVASHYSLQMPSTQATPDWWQVMEHEKASRVSRSHQLEVLEYQPCVQDSVLHLVQGWHLLFFARTGTTHIQEIRSTVLRPVGRAI